MSDNARKTLVAVGLCIPGTGFTRVLHNLLSRLGAEMDIHWLGIAYKGPIVHQSGYTLYPNNLRGGDIYGAYRTSELVNELSANWVLLLNDVYMLHNYRHTLSGMPVRTLAYIPLDGRITKPELIAPISFLDAVVAYTNDSKTQFSKNFDTLINLGDIERKPSVFTAYHGIENSLLPQQEESQDDKILAFKEEVFGHIKGWRDTIFILNANRYAERKDPETSLRGFAIAKDHCKAPIRLCLHIPNTDENKKRELLSLVSQYQLEKEVIINPLGENYVDSNELRKLYYACEIGINTSIGEGWGLVSFEHAACGGAQIIPGHDNQKEIWESAALYIEQEEAIYIDTNPFLMYKLSAESLATHITDLVNNQDRLDHMKYNAKMHTRNPQFDWDEIAAHWSYILSVISG